jgi:hypothetical protein
MANFKTHLSVASTLSGILAIGCLEVDLATPRDVVVYFAVGTIGGLLPDVDSDHSVPVQILFSFLAIMLAFMTVFSKATTYSIVELSLLWIVIYVVVRYVVSKLFTSCTVHRGIFHSLLAALFFCLLTTTLAYHLFALSPFAAWLTGGFVCIGYLTHLTLDELYGVDLMGATLKKSFGSALKPASFANLKATICLSLATILLFLFTTPKLDALVQTIGNRQIYKTLQHRLLPKDRWFKVQAQGSRVMAREVTLGGQCWYPATRRCDRRR